MRVCVVGESHPLAYMGGAEYQTGLLADILAQHHDVRLTYLVRRLPTAEQIAQLPYDIRCIGSGAGIRRRAVFFDAPELHRVLVELRPDVIYQQAKQSYTAVCAHYARQAGVPFFYHVASDADLDNRWISLRLSPNTPFDIVESVAGDWGIGHASDVIVQTQQQAASLRSRFKREPSILVRNFQPMPVCLPVKPESPLTVLWVANFKDVKRPELFADLAESLSERKDLKFVMVGQPNAVRRFQLLIKRIASIPNLTYLGAQPVDRVYELMTGAAMHVNTSSFEGFPNTFIQAWARGAVVASIAVDPDGVMEQHGLGYRTGSPEGLRHRIQQLADSASLRQSVAARAFEFARTHHSLDAGAQLAHLILSTAAASKQKPAP